MKISCILQIFSIFFLELKLDIHCAELDSAVVSEIGRKF